LDAGGRYSLFKASKKRSLKMSMLAMAAVNDTASNIVGAVAHLYETVIHQYIVNSLAGFP
jgi:hypothetical protein